MEGWPHRVEHASLRPFHRGWCNGIGYTSIGDGSQGARGHVWMVWRGIYPQVRKLGRCMARQRPRLHEATIRPLPCIIYKTTTSPPCAVAVRPPFPFSIDSHCEHQTPFAMSLSASRSSSLHAPNARPVVLIASHILQPESTALADPYCYSTVVQSEMELQLPCCR